MSTRYDKPVRVLLLVPLAVFAAMLLCFGLACLLEKPTGRDGIYTSLLALSLMSMLLCPLPCAAMSVTGIVLTAKARGYGMKKTPLWFVLGAAELLGAVSWGLYAARWILSISTYV